MSSRNRRSDLSGMVSLWLEYPERTPEQVMKETERLLRQLHVMGVPVTYAHVDVMEGDEDVTFRVFKGDDIAALDPK